LYLYIKYYIKNIFNNFNNNNIDINDNIDININNNNININDNINNSFNNNNNNINNYYNIIINTNNIISNCTGMGEAKAHLAVRGRVHLTETKGT